jgi:transposase
MATTNLQQRVMIKELSMSGMTDREIGRQLQISPYTVRKWRRKAKAQGSAGLHSRMGRPRRGAMSTYPPHLADRLRSWRKAHPGWGPKTLQTELENDKHLQGQRLPGESVITRWLRQENLSRRYEKHSSLPAVCTSPAQYCHEEWEMDARGHEKIPDVGVISLINVNDVFSKAKILSYPCYLGKQRASRHPSTEDYQLTLRLAFTEWGLPNRLAVDHDSVFFDNHSKSPFPTHLHLWLLALGVDLTFGRMGQPKDQAMTERSHQTWQHQVLDGQQFGSLLDLFHTLTGRRHFLNYSLPCATLGEVPPLVAYPQATTPHRIYRPEWESSILDLSRVHACLSQGRWFRKASNIGAVSLGGTSYCLGRDWIRAEVEITLDAADQHLVFRAGDKQRHLGLKGLSIPDLMGEQSMRVHPDAFQLALPFTWNQWRQLQACQLLSSTTL